MSKCDKLLKKAERSPNNFSFADICELAECSGFRFVRQSGSHAIYENEKLLPKDGRIMNFQNVHGKAKPYQVKQLLKAISNIEDGN